MFDNRHDWNGNGHRDVGDSYMDYEIMNDKASKNRKSSNGGSGGKGGGCLFAILIVVGLLYLLGSCS